MSEKQQDEQARLAAWRALQIELGLEPPESEQREVPAYSEVPSPTPPESAAVTTMEPCDKPPVLAPIAPPAPSLTVRRPERPNLVEEPADDLPPSDGFGAGILEQLGEIAAVPEPDVEHLTSEDVATGDGSAEHEVEMGEAPEEVPDGEPEVEAEAETEPNEEKRPNRRRRGRRRRRSDGDGDRSNAHTGRDEAEQGSPMDKVADDEVADSDDEEEDVDEGGIEPFADWSVPSWQELIGSLYRPER
jgi:hypothetical protein